MGGEQIPEILDSNERRQFVAVLRSGEQPALQDSDP